MIIKGYQTNGKHNVRDKIKVHQNKTKNETHGLTVSGILDDTHLQNDVDRFFFPVGRTPAVDGVLPVRKGSKA